MWFEKKDKKKPLGQEEGKNPGQRRKRKRREKCRGVGQNAGLVEKNISM